MSNEIEQIIAQLIEKHGAEKVRAQLETLIGRGKWSDWQRVANLVDRIARRQTSQKRPLAKNRRA